MKIVRLFKINSLSETCIQLYFSDAEEIALLEPLGVAHNAIERLNVSGQDVLVTGCGPVGLLAQNVAKALGAKR